jgi:energy-coupling factor transporter ATP-binding protein EcfA2
MAVTARARGNGALTGQGPLRFAHLRLENWKNFRVVDTALRQRAFLVGPNASGKSNLIDAFRFLHDIVSVGGGFRRAVEARGGVSTLRCLAARRYSDILVRADLGADEEANAWTYVLRFNQDNQRRPQVREEVVLRGGRPLLQRPDEQDRLDPERLTQTYLEQVNVNREFREIADAFANIRYLHIVPQLIREPERSAGRVDDPFGGDFLERIAATPSRTLSVRLRRLGEALKVAVPQLQDLELTRDERGAPHLRGRYQHWRPQGAWQGEELFSDGTLRLVGLLWAVLDGHGPLLLEEPELSLHPEVVRYLPQMFARVQQRQRRQLIISTHSPELLTDEGIGVDEVLVLEPSAEGTSVRLAQGLPDINELMDGGLSLADVVVPQTRPAGVQQLALFGGG